MARKKRERLDYDTVLKDLFEHDRPSLLDRITGGREVAESLNTEFAAVQKRVADLLLKLAGGECVHIDFQCRNDRWMAHRAGVYGLMAARKYRRPGVEQVVVYLGEARMKMESRLDIGCSQVSYRLIDIREYSAAELLATGRSRAGAAGAGRGRADAGNRGEGESPAGRGAAASADADGGFVGVARGCRTIENGDEVHGNPSRDREERIPAGCARGGPGRRPGRRPDHCPA